MVWIYYKFARVEQNCGKQRQLKQLPDEMWKRKPMSGGTDPYPGLEAIETQGIWSRRQSGREVVKARVFSFNRFDGLGEFYD